MSFELEFFFRSNASCMSRLLGPLSSESDVFCNIFFSSRIFAGEHTRVIE